MKKLIILMIMMLLATVSIVAYRKYKNELIEKLNMEILTKEKKEIEEQKIAFQNKLQAKADSALLYAKERGFDLDHAFLIDFSLHSGKHRLFVWNFKNKAIEYSSLCAHGIGNGELRNSHTNIIFSNIEGSYCSSLGKYKTGARSYSNWGINVHYKLHGLEKSNSNAFKRIVVLHSHSPIPSEEIYPEHIPLGYSQGCPVIDDQSMRKIDELIKSKEKPILLWIYI